MMSLTVIIGPQKEWGFSNDQLVSLSKFMECFLSVFLDAFETGHVKSFAVYSFRDISLMVIYLLKVCIKAWDRNSQFLGKEVDKRKKYSTHSL